VLRDVNDDVLARLGGNWAGPPVLARGWEHDERLESLRAGARDAFTGVYGQAAAWVWKDPRNCITLPFWEQTVGIDAVVLHVHRNPLAVADSLHERDEFSRPVSLALWERHVRDGLRNAAGHRLLGASSDEIVADPIGWVARVRRVALDAGLELGPAPSDAAVTRVIDTELQHGSYTAGDLRGEAQVSEAQRALFDVLEKVTGSHDRFAVPELPPATPGIDLLLAEHARFYEEREVLREKLARAREHDRHVINVRRIKIRTYALYRRLRERGG
jgi:hypothetical protein